LLTLQAEHPERIIAVSWGEAEADRFEADIGIEAYDRQGLLADVTRVMAQQKVNVTAINTYSDRNTNTAHMKLRVEVDSIEVLSRVLAKLDQLDNVISAQRVREQ
jgi:GTP pyrophosphokinase